MSLAAPVWWHLLLSQSHRLCYSSTVSSSPPFYSSCMSNSIHLHGTGPGVKNHSAASTNGSWVCPSKQGDLKCCSEQFIFKTHTHIYTSGRTFKALFPKMYDKFLKYSTQMLLPTPYLQCVIHTNTPNIHRTQQERHSSSALHLNTVLWKNELKEIFPGEMAAPKPTEVSTRTTTEVRKVWIKSLHFKGKAPFRLRGWGQEHLRQLSAEICPFIRSQKCIKVV